MHAWCLRCNIFGAWFLDIRIYQLVPCYAFLVPNYAQITLQYEQCCLENNIAQCVHY